MIHFVLIFNNKYLKVIFKLDKDSIKLMKESAKFKIIQIIYSFSIYKKQGLIFLLIADEMMLL